MLLRLLLICLLGLIYCPTVQAHGDLHERIVATTQEIKQHPDSAYLYIKRAKLYHQHQAYRQSLKDVKKAKSLKYAEDEQQLLFAKNYLALGKLNKSLKYSESIIVKRPKNVAAINLKAQVLFEQKKYEQAALAFEDVIEFSSVALPENFIDASLAWSNVNTVKAMQNSFSVIDSGINELGKLVTFYTHLIELSINREDYESAIAHQKEMLALFQRKESVYYRLSQLYVLAEDFEHAEESLRQAKISFLKLPIRIQNAPNMKALWLNFEKQEHLLQSKINDE